MVCAAFSEGRSIIHRLDPRVRVTLGVAFAVVVAVSTRPAVGVAGVAIGVLLAGLARLDAGAVVRRLLAVNGFLVVLLAVLAVTMGGEALATLGPVRISAAGVRRGVGVICKANAIVLAVTALVSTMHLVTAAHALGRLGAPAKLTHLFFFTARYSDVLHHEYARLRRTMRVRGFRPGANLHTYRTFGYLLGVLLVRSFDRSGRILDAMKCRGFAGQFPPIRPLTLQARDGVFVVAGLGVLAALAALELQWIH